MCTTPGAASVAPSNFSKTSVNFEVSSPPSVNHAESDGAGGLAPASSQRSVNALTT